MSWWLSSERLIDSDAALRHLKLYLTSLSQDGAIDPVCRIVAKRLCPMARATNNLRLSSPIDHRQSCSYFDLTQFPHNLGSSIEESEDLGIDLVYVFSFLFERHNFLGGKQKTVNVDPRLLFDQNGGKLDQTSAF
jgi:hypothetical protein